MIRADEIDILVDLTMHMARHRLLLFARLPPPCRSSWLAYPGTTGLKRSTFASPTRFSMPAEADLRCYSERSSVGRLVLVF